MAARLSGQVAEARPAVHSAGGGAHQAIESEEPS
jgi:hypothetical protein